MDSLKSLLSVLAVTSTANTPIVGRFPHHYTPRYGSYSEFSESFRDDQARIQRAAERRGRKAKRNGYVYTPPAQLHRERSRGHSHARYITY